jgi:DNA-binding NtrC family response regulator
MIGNTEKNKSKDEEKLVPYEKIEYKGQYNLKKLEKTLIVESLIVANGNKTKASRLLKIDLRTLYRKMIKHKITLENKFVCLTVY